VVSELADKIIIVISVISFIMKNVIAD
jgi:hypothetical protein